MRTRRKLKFWKRIKNNNMETKTIIIFFLITILIAGGWIALEELAGFKTLWAALLSISVGAGAFYLYQRFK